jgi:hypothetical protein
MKKHLSPKTLDETGPTLLPRRQFLVLGSAAVGAAAVTSLSSDIVRSVLAIDDPAPRLSVGFAEVKFEDFAQPSFVQRMASASAPRSGDASLENGVRLKIHGLVRPEAAKGQQASMALDAMYRVAGQGEAVPFMAWSYSSNPSLIPNRASNSFVMPVSAKQPLSLAFSTSATNAIDSKAKLNGTIDLTLGNGRRQNKLRTGVYFVAVCPAGTKAPDWNAIHAVASEGALPQLKVATLIGTEPVPFDYIVMTMDRA